MHCPAQVTRTEEGSGSFFLSEVPPQLHAYTPTHLSLQVLQAPPQADGTLPYFVPLSAEALSSRDEDSVIRLLSGVINGNSCIVCSMVVGINVSASGCVLQIC